MLRVLTSIVWVSNPQGRLKSPQALWQKYTGQAWEEHQELGWQNAIHPDDRPLVAAKVEEAILERSHFHGQARLWHAETKSYRHNVTRAIPIIEAGEVTHWVGTSTDIDDCVRAEQALKAADREKDEFIAVLAHELRAPLAPIRNAAQILKRRGKEDIQLAWTRDVIERQVSQMSHLLDDLLDVSRLREKKIELNKTRVTLDGILDAAIEVSRPLLEQRGHHLELNILAGPSYVEADRHRLAQVFSNLLTNAAKYTQPGGRISLNVRTEQGFAAVSVKDNGVGIAPEFLPNVFQLFSQARVTPSRNEGGLGIGLTIAKAITEMHGGSLCVHSDGPGRGSEFTVKIPLARSREQRQSAHDSARRPTRSFRIVVADDDRDTGETLKVLLELMGHEVDLAADGEEALATTFAKQPDVVLLDIGMPKLDGYEVARRLRSLLPETVLVALTGRAQPEDLRRAQESGFDRHCVKPIAPDGLELLLSELAETPRNRRTGTASGRP